MKTILTIAFVAFLAVTTSAVATNVHPSYSQSAANSPFSYFRAHRQMNAVAMLWAVNQQGAAGYKVERSYDSQDYHEVDILPAHGAAQYKYTDRNPGAGFIYYRITAVDAIGESIGVSQVQTVRIVSRR